MTARRLLLLLGLCLVVGFVVAVLTWPGSAGMNWALGILAILLSSAIVSLLIGAFIREGMGEDDGDKPTRK